MSALSWSELATGKSPIAVTGANFLKLPKIVHSWCYQQACFSHNSCESWARSDILATIGLPQHLPNTANSSDVAHNCKLFTIKATWKLNLTLLMLEIKFIVRLRLQG